MNILNQNGKIFIPKFIPTSLMQVLTMKEEDHFEIVQNR